MIKSFLLHSFACHIYNQGPAYDANGTYSTTLFKNEALDILGNHTEKHGDEPLFLYLAFNAIHDTLSVPTEFEASTVYQDLIVNLTDDGRQKAAGAMYLVDSAIGNTLTSFNFTCIKQKTIHYFLLNAREI